MNADKYNSGIHTPVYNDRIVAHEMVYNVMARTTNFASLPKWFKEGTAEINHGDEERVAAHKYLDSAFGIVSSIGNGTDVSWNNTSLQYASGYVAVQ